MTVLSSKVLLVAKPWVVAFKADILVNCSIGRPAIISDIRSFDLGSWSEFAISGPKITKAGRRIFRRPAFVSFPYRNAFATWVGSALQGVADADRVQAGVQTAHAHLISQLG